MPARYVATVGSSVSNYYATSTQDQAFNGTFYAALRSTKPLHDTEESMAVEYLTSSGAWKDVYDRDITVDPKAYGMAQEISGLPPGFYKVSFSVDWANAHPHLRQITTNTIEVAN